MSSRISFFVVCLLLLGIGTTNGQTQDKAKADDATQEKSDEGKQDKSKKAETEEKFEPPKHWIRLAKNREIWADMKKKQVIVGGKICLKEGLLELFACSMDMKTHESVVSVNARSSEIHAGLLAVGAKPGNPVEFDPKFKAAKGPKVKVIIRWKEKGKWVERRAQEMIKNSKSKKELDMDFVFGGSKVWVDPDTGQKVYYGDSGDFICVSNFTSATLDLPVASSASNDALTWETNSKKIPDLGTKVYVYLKPEIKKKDDGKSKVDGPKKSADKDSKKSGDK